MNHVYIAYHHDDGTFVAGLIRQIEDAGFRVWSDHERLRADDTHWRGSIDQAIRDAFALLVVVTPAGRASEQVNYEWTFALGTDIPVIPVIRQPADLHPRQESLTLVDFTDPETQPWGKLLRLIHEANDAATHEPDTRDASDRPGPPWRRPSDRPSPIERLRRGSRPRGERAELPPLTGSRETQREKLFDALESDDRDRRIRAAHRLGEMDDRAGIPALIKVLRDDDWRVREAAASALARLKATAAVPSLLETLRQSRSGPFGNGGPNKIIVNALRDIGTDSIPVLIDALSDDDARVRLVIVDLLGEFGDTDAIPALARALYDPEPRVRWRAADALGRIGSEIAVPNLVTMLNDENKDVRISAAWALGQIGHQAGLEGLLKMLHDREWRSRWAAVQALWEMGAIAVPALIVKLYDADEYVRRAAIHALAEIREPAIEPLIATLGAPDWDARWGAAAALQAIGDKAVPALVSVLDAPDWQTSWAAAETLKRIGTKDALQAADSWHQSHDHAAAPDPAHNDSDRTPSPASSPDTTDPSSKDG